MPDRVIVSDDGSRDGTVEMLATCAPTFALDVVQNDRQLGVVANFEAALRRTRGDLIFLCDQDDIWHKDKIQRMVAEAERNRSALLIYSDARIVDAAGRATGAMLLQALQPSRRERAWLQGGRPLAALLRRNFVTGATVALRRELLADALPIPQGFWHDEWLALVAAALGELHRMEEPLIDYRIHSGNQAGLRGVTRAAKWHAMTSRRGGYHGMRVRKLELLQQRLELLGDRVPADRLHLVRQCRQHWIERAALPPSRGARLTTIGRELRLGRYRQFSTGWRSAVRDLLEPLP